MLCRRGVVITILTFAGRALCTGYTSYVYVSLHLFLTANANEISNYIYTCFPDEETEALRS